MLEYDVIARRRDGSGNTASAKNAEVDMDTSLDGRSDALNPVELLVAALAACMIKGVERSAPLLKFRFTSVGVALHAVR